MNNDDTNPRKSHPLEVGRLEQQSTPLSLHPKYLMGLGAVVSLVAFFTLPAVSILGGMTLSEIANLTRPDLKIMFYAIPLACVLAFVLMLSPKTIKEMLFALTGITAVGIMGLLLYTQNLPGTGFNLQIGWFAALGGLITIGIGVLLCLFKR
jgi:hypothetical protein